jgi:hypothetical protein
VIVLLDEGAGLSVRRVGPWDRLQARLRASALDRQLAAGTSPESTATLAIHASHLCAPAQRRLLARRLEQIVETADAPARRTQVPVCRAAVRRARHELDQVAGRLSGPGPVDVRAIARLRALISDGTGPLYRPSHIDGLRNELHAALASMDVHG